MGQDHKKVLKEFLGEFYDLSNIDSSAIFSAVPEKRGSSSLTDSGRSDRYIIILLFFFIFYFFYFFIFFYFFFIFFFPFFFLTDFF